MIRIACLLLVALLVAPNARAELRCERVLPSAYVAGQTLAIEVQYCGDVKNGRFRYTALKKPEGQLIAVWPSDWLKQHATNMLICYNQSRISTPQKECSEYAPDGLKVDKTVASGLELALEGRHAEAVQVMYGVLQSTPPRRYGAWPAAVFTLAAPSKERAQSEWMPLLNASLDSLEKARDAHSQDAFLMLDVLAQY